jgi:hypothetical protein
LLYLFREILCEKSDKYNSKEEIEVLEKKISSDIQTTNLYEFLNNLSLIDTFPKLLGIKI